jgi:hypothetical protein
MVSLRKASKAMGRIQKGKTMDRRHVLGLVGAGAASLAASAARAATTPVIEWNMHMFSSNVAKFPFSPRGTYKPDAARLSADPLVDYQAHMKAFGAHQPQPVQGHQHVLPQG